MKIFNLTSLLLLLLITIQATSAFDNNLSTFTDQTNPFTYIFTAPAYPAYTIPFPRYSRVNNISLNITSMSYSPIGICFQEFANISTPCGGLSTGYYSYSSGEWDNVTALFDGNNATKTFPSGTGIVYVNYTRPSLAENATWLVRDSSGFTYININPGCFYSNPILRLRFLSYGATTEASYQCFNTSNQWQEIYLKPSNGDSHIFEESVYWGMHNLSYLDVAVIINGSVAYNSTGSSLVTNTFSLSSTLANNLLKDGRNVSVALHSNSIQNVTIQLMNSSYSYGIDNCSLYTVPILNWTYFSSIPLTTTADDKINVSFDYGIDQQNFTQYSYNISSMQLCGLTNQTNVSSTGSIKYTGDWTGGYIYNYQFSDIEFNSNITYLNLTVPKLFLNFSQATDITVVTTEETYYFESATVLMVPSNLSVGKISVIYNEGTQYFEYYNDHNTNIDEDLEVIANEDTYINVRVQDQSFNILSEARTKIYELDNINNETVLVDSIYGNNEKQIKLTGNQTYQVKSFLEDYTQDNSYFVFTPTELQGSALVITMNANGSSDNINIYTSTSNNLPFGQGQTSYDIDIFVESSQLMRDVLIEWLVNGTTSLSDSVMTGDDNDFSATKIFTANYANLTATVRVYDADNIYHERVFFFKNVQRETRYETTFYEALLYSKFAFAIFFIFLISVAGGVQNTFKNYGIATFMGGSVLLSFINLYMLIPAITTMIGLFLKKNLGDDI